MLLRALYSAPIAEFVKEPVDTILGKISSAGGGGSTQQQFRAWVSEIAGLQHALLDFVEQGHVFVEFEIPRLGRRVDVLLVIQNAVFILEFKVNQETSSSARNQALDYAMDLKHFHSTSHDIALFPIVVSETTWTRSSHESPNRAECVADPVDCSIVDLPALIPDCILDAKGPTIDATQWSKGEYHPTPTIIEAAARLYAGHDISAISRSDAGARNLVRTTGYVLDVVRAARERGTKAICFVTGVPGAGKTLVGLDIAAKRRANEDEHSVYLSGNGPLVAVLREALVCDAVKRSRQTGDGQPLTKSRAGSSVKKFIQNVHHFRDEYLRNETSPPFEHVAIFDEAQRAWNRDQAQTFMKRRKGLETFLHSEAEYLISCMDRHTDWAVVVCLVGGGQEIHTGEAGIQSWLAAIGDRFPHWQVHISPELMSAEYNQHGDVEHALARLTDVRRASDLHLSVSMRSYRAEKLSSLVKHILDINGESAKAELDAIRSRYPIRLTRSFDAAKDWVRTQSRGSQRFGMVVSSKAQRLKPYAIDVRTPMNPVHWFLKEREDVRSSYFLEDVATEFHIQGLELDWTVVAWDADFRYTDKSWKHYSFEGDKWKNVKQPERQLFQLNAYRVLLTRARLGMVIVVPEGSDDDETRLPRFYDSTYEYLRGIGIELL